MTRFAFIAGILTWSLAHRRTVITLAALFAVAAGVLVPRTGVDVLPDVTRPTLVIMAEAPGLAAEDVETRVSRPVEVAASGLPHALRVRSSSVLGLSVVMVDLDWGTDTMAVRQLAAERLSTIRDQLPAGITPQIQPVSSIMGEVLLLGLTSNSVPPTELRAFADWVLRPRLIAAPGVSQVTVIGGRIEQLQIAPDLAAMAALDVTTGDVERALAQSGIPMTGGILDRAGSETVVRVLTNSLTPVQIAAAVVVQREGQPITLGQIAEVGPAEKPTRGAAGVDGQDAVILSVQKQPGADTRLVTREVETALRGLQSSLPKGVEATRLLFRQADFISAGLGNVTRLLLESSIAVSLVILLFLGGWRPTVVSLLAIPLSLLGAVLALLASGLSLNVLTLGGLAIAIGELVDDAVVDVENITRRLRQNALLSEPAPIASVLLTAVQEVRSGIVQATAIIALSMVPLLLVPGVEGLLLRPLAIAYMTAMAASLVVALTLTPALASTMMLARRAPAEPAIARIVHEHADRAAAAALERPRLVTAASAAVLAASLVAAATLPRALMPAFNEGSLTIEVSSRPGISLNASAVVGRAAEILILGVDGVKSTGRRTGRAELDDHTQGVETSEIDVALTGARPRAAVVADIRTALAVLPVSVNVGQPISHRIEHMTSGLRAQIAVKIFGGDHASLALVADALRAKLAGLRGLADLQLERQALLPTLDLRIDNAQAALFGVVPAAANEAAALMAGKTLSEPITGGRRLEVVLRLTERNRTADELAGLLLEAPGGRVPLSSVARLEQRQALSRIEREDGERRLALYGNFDAGGGAQTIVAIENIIAGLQLPPGVRIKLEGTFATQATATRQMLIAGMAALALAFGGLAASYGSWRLAAIVLTGVPLAFAGGFLALLVSGQALSLATAVGFVTVAGIATRNGILKVDSFIRKSEIDALSRSHAARAATAERVVAVALTALAALAGLLPILAAGADVPGSEILYPVATVVFGGLTFATLLDVVVTPVLLTHWIPPAGNYR